MTEPKKLTVGDTIAKSFAIAVEERGARTALREKDLGIWRSISWRDWMDKSKAIAFALHASGFRPGDDPSILSIRSRNGSMRIWGRWAPGRLLGHLSHRRSQAGRISAGHSSSKVIFVEDDEQLDKVLTVRARCPQLEDDRHRRDGRPVRFRRSDGHLAQGFHRSRQGLHQGPEDLWQETLDSRCIEDLAVFWSVLRAPTGHRKERCTPTRAC